MSLALASRETYDMRLADERAQQAVHREAMGRAAQHERLRHAEAEVMRQQAAIFIREGTAPVVAAQMLAAARVLDGSQE